MAPLSYTPLKTARSEVRVLTLHPARKAEDPIRCSLKTVSLDDSPKYDALSYVWGDATITKPIWVDGHEVQVTVNLEAALRRLRHHAKRQDRVVWADAVCINQQSRDEKNTQVPLMGRVYSQASDVFVWLGDSTPYIDLFLESARTHSKRRRRFAERLRVIGDLLGVAKYKERDLVPYFRLRNGALQLAAFPYWTRMWTFQEFRLPRADPVLMCGPHCVRASDQLALAFHAGKKKYERITRAGRVTEPAWGKLPELDRLRNVQERILNGSYLPGLELNEDHDRAAVGPNTITGLRELGFMDEPEVRHFDTSRPPVDVLVDVLYHMGFRTCSDPHDHVYSLNGLAPALQGLFPVDYGIDVRLLFWQVMAYILGEWPTALGLLSNVFHLVGSAVPASNATSNSQAGTVPSWTVDFSRPFRLTGEHSRNYFPLNPTRDPYRGSLADEAWDTTHLLSDGKTLRLKSRTLGTFGPALLRLGRATEDEKETACAILALADQYGERPSSAPPPPSSISPRHRLLRALTANFFNSKTTYGYAELELLLRGRSLDWVLPESPEQRAAPSLKSVVTRWFSALQGMQVLAVTASAGLPSLLACGMGGPNVQEGDVVALAAGLASCPVILRAVENDVGVSHVGENAEKDETGDGTSSRTGPDPIGGSPAAPRRFRLVGHAYISGVIDDDCFDGVLWERIVQQEAELIDIV